MIVESRLLFCATVNRWGGCGVLFRENGR